MNHMDQYRKSPRAKWLEYNEGVYFLTICTLHHAHYFGSIVNGEMRLSALGAFLRDELEHVALHHPHVSVLQYVVMPNHVHAIVKIGEYNATRCVPINTQDDPNNATRCVPTCEERVGKKIQCGKRPLLSTFVGSLKAAVTRHAHIIATPFAWQTRYHDHVIRGVDDCNKIATYIDNNVANWETDCFYTK
ncbi:MAG: transposase [Parabacteroides sp.]